MSTDQAQSGASDEFTAEAVQALVEAKSKELGGPEKAAAAWGCTTQMVYMTIRGDRRPTASMLADLGLEQVKVPASITYRRKA